MTQYPITHSDKTTCLPPNIANRGNSYTDAVLRTVSSHILAAENSSVNVVSARWPIRGVCDVSGVSGSTTFRLMVAAIRHPQLVANVLQARLARLERVRTQRPSYHTDPGERRGPKPKSLNDEQLVQRRARRAAQERARRQLQKEKHEI